MEHPVKTISGSEVTHSCTSVGDVISVDIICFFKFHGVLIGEALMKNSALSYLSLKNTKMSENVRKEVENVMKNKEERKHVC